MAGSFQEEIPSARVNIQLDVHTGSARKKVELPLKLVVAGDFSGKESDLPVAEREKINVNKNNLDAVLKDFSPELNIAVPHHIGGREGEEIPVRLKFESMKDFRPEQVVRQIPELGSLLAMRNLLKDLKANILDNSAFRRELEKVIKDDVSLQQLRVELEKLAPLSGDPSGSQETAPRKPAK